ncbi:hypothetical protein NMY22_g19987 [Coprinellus aureogranulatus]|nr:hypothetical protein NMY22_g19987 [Coprinellus aureogranulatus]
MTGEPLSSGLHHCKAYADHALSLVRGDKRPIPKEMSFRGLTGLMKIVEKYQAAWDNAVRVPLSIAKIIEGIESGQPPHPQGEDCDALLLVDEPTVILDVDDTIVGWYVPDLFTNHQIDYVFESVQALSKAHGCRISGGAFGRRWRMADDLYADREKCSIQPGEVTMQIQCSVSGKEPEVSSALRDPEGSALDFLRSQMETNALLGAFHCLIDPDGFSEQTRTLMEVFSNRAGSLDEEYLRSIHAQFGQHTMHPRLSDALMLHRVPEYL